MTAKLSVREWIAAMRQEENATVKRREQLLFDIASFVLKQAKFYADKNFGRGRGKTARTKGRSGALKRSIEMARVNSGEFIVTAGGPGVPYAAVQELGTVGKGGKLPTIVPRNAQWLTIPDQPQYIGRRAREFKDLRFVPVRDDFAMLVNSKGSRAYLLVKRVDIPPRPYLEPAAKDAAKEQRFVSALKLIYGKSKLPYEVNRI